MGAIKVRSRKKTPKAGTKKKKAVSTGVPKKAVVGLQLSSKLAHQFDELIRKGLVASGAVSERDNQNFTLTLNASGPTTVAVDIEPEMAAFFDGLIRRGLVASHAVSEADNANFNLTIRKPRRK